MPIPTAYTEVTLLTGTPGPHGAVQVSISPESATTWPPILLEDPAPSLLGIWRRVSEPDAAPTYVRIARIAAP